MANRKKRRKRRRRQDMMVLRLLVLVVLVLVVFEGRLIRTMFTQSSDKSDDIYSSGSTLSQGNAGGSGAGGSGGNALLTSETDFLADDEPDASDTSGIGTSDVALAGLTISSSASSGGNDNGSGQSSAAEAEYIDSPAVVPFQTPAMDDSYFSDAVFIGDSRMEGFRNTSGITQGTFLTSVGMTLTSISDTKIQTSDGNITVYQGLSGIQYGKIYLMLGTNDLGFYPMEEFLITAESVFEQFHKLQPDAIIYICSVIYVEESKVVTDYVNNENVIAVNQNLVKACEDLPYCHYVNLNEILSDGYHSLIAGASQDGVHLYADYSKLMLNYLKTHYLT